MSPSRFQFWIPLTLAAACWGLATVISKAVLAQVPPLALLAIQLLTSVIFLWGVLAAQRTPFRWQKIFLSLGLLGWLNPGISYTFSLLGLALTTASMSALLWAVEPVLIIALAWLILRERLTVWLVGWAAIALIGVALVAGAGAGPSGSLLGNGLVLAGVLCCAVYTVLTRRLNAEVAPLTITALQQSCALIWALAIWPLELAQTGLAPLAALSASTWFWVIISGVMYYGLAYWFYLTGLRQAPASVAAASFNLIPLFALLGAYFFLNERLAPAQWLGAALILLAVFGILRPTEKTRLAASPNAGP